MREVQGCYQTLLTKYYFRLPTVEEKLSDYHFNILVVFLDHLNMLVVRVGYCYVSI